VTLWLALGLAFGAFAEKALNRKPAVAA
jgi:hypothetical protein